MNQCPWAETHTLALPTECLLLFPPGGQWKFSSPQLSIETHLAIESGIRQTGPWLKAVAAERPFDSHLLKCYFGFPKAKDFLQHCRYTNIMKFRVDFYPLPFK